MIKKLIASVMVVFGGLFAIRYAITIDPLDAIQALLYLIFSHQISESEL